MNHRYRFLLLVVIAQLLFILNMTMLSHRHHQAPHAAAASTYLIDVDAQTATPVEIKAAAGSELLMVRKSGIVGTDVALTEGNTDGGNTALLTVRQNGTAVPQGYTLVRIYKVNRAGNASIVVTHKVPMPGAKPTTDTIKVIGQ
jgi:hypothetical protein